jgi:uncharacterized protein YcbK (DUF882 family)
MDLKKHKIEIALGLLLLLLGGYLAYVVIRRKKNIQEEKIEGGSEIPETEDETEDIFDEETGDESSTPCESSAHFSMSEFDSNDGVAVPDMYKANVCKLMEQLEIIREELGNNSIHINSGYRTPSHNASVGGVSNSQHLIGKAADIRVANKTPTQVKQAIEKLISEGKILEGGVGYYPTFIHYDIRGTKARW